MNARTRMRSARLELWLAALLFAAVTGLLGRTAARGGEEVLLARYVTHLRTRTPNQVYNVELAARSIDGRELGPGEVFSFNGALGPWSSDSGYKRAPVSYDGELVPSWGGGVCQASTTLYNAALLAGLEIVERHRHRWVPKYIAPGRDAAVAYSSIDLRFRNPYPWPVRLGAETRGDLVEFRILGRGRPSARYLIRSYRQAAAEPGTVRQPWRPGLPARSVRNPGRAGCRVKTYRITLEDGREVRRELLSDDDYPAMNRLVLRG